MAGGIVKSLQKAVDIINCLAKNGEMGVTELSNYFDLAKSSVYNILNTLAKNRIVEKNEITSKYKLGLRLFELGNIVRDRLELREISASFMKDLVDRVEETAHSV